MRLIKNLYVCGVNTMLDLFTAAGMTTNRPYQDDAVQAVIDYLKKKPGNPIICAATGTGKSVIIASLIKRILAANSHARIMVATHVAELLEQNAGKLRGIMPQADIGLYSAGLGQKDSHNQIVFAGIQSIYRASGLGSFNLLIVDEVHTISRKDKSMWKSLIDGLLALNPKLRIVGLSATPFRMDSGSLTDGEESLFTDIVFDYGLGRAIQDGYLVPLTAKDTKTKYDVSGVGKIAGEFNLKELEAATNVDSLTQKAVAEIIDAGANRKSWLIFCNGVAHSFAVRDEFRRMGIVCETVTGETPDNERADILAGFKSGTIKAVTNNAVWTTGVDVPHVDLIGMLRHTMSGGLLLQMAGRGTRVVIDAGAYETSTLRRKAIAESAKPNCLFLDFAGNIYRHGFLDQIKAKEKGAKGDGVAPMKACPDCFSICHAAAKNCKDCGYEFPMNEVSVIGDSYDGQVLGGAPDDREVLEVQYMGHNLNHETKEPCLRVKYIHPDGRQTNEYVSIGHSKPYVRQKARKWWNERHGDDIDGMSVEKIVNSRMCDNLMIPSMISVKKDGKFDRIICHHNLQWPKAGMVHSIVYEPQNFAPKTDEDDFEIPF